MNQKNGLSERDVCTKYILPAIAKAGWNIESHVCEEVTFTDGRIFLKGSTPVRGERKRADIVLYRKLHIPIAVIEVKDATHSIGSGLQQAMNYAQILDVPTAISSNGSGFLDHDFSGLNPEVERELGMNAIPSPDELWARYKRYKRIDTPEEERVADHEYYFDGSGRSPRYYQQIAINRAVEAIAGGRRRLLLVMATGTGKTYAAFQIIWRLWKSGVTKRILFLTDRNALISQTKRGDPELNGTALLEMIREEKKRLIAEGKIRKEKTLAPIEAREVPFEIPEGWGWCGISQLLNNNANSLKAGPFGSSLKKDCYTK